MATPLGVDREGHPVDTLADHDARFVAAFFIATDCPISNRYLPEMARLAQQFSPLGVRFWLIYPNPADDLKSVRAHQSNYAQAAAFRTLIAPDPLLVKRAGVHVTPEAAVFRSTTAGSEPAIWHGPLDDRYIAIGQQRVAASRHYLTEALQASLRGVQPAPAAQHAVGCAIVPRT